jgi:hypothetical protein
MKTLLAGVILCTAVCSCNTYKELQADMIKAELIKIDTINRYSNDARKQQLTWRDEYNLEYVSIVPLQETYVLGTKLLMLRPK